jgi:AcrR family transcriptional regulator
LILEATIELLSARLPSQVTVRDIAAKAGVQHSLITRQFGSKDALIVQAVEEVARSYAEAVRTAGSATEGYVAAMRHFRNAPASGLALVGPQSGRGRVDSEERFPGYAAHLRQLLDAGAPDELDTYVFANMMIGIVASWPLMEHAAVEAAGLDPKDLDEVRAASERVLAELIATRVARPSVDSDPGSPGVRPARPTTTQ